MKWFDSAAESVGKFFSFGDDEMGRATPHHPSTQSFYDGSALARLISLRSFDSETMMAINNNSYGYVLELAPLNGADEETVRQLAQAYSSMGENVYGQIILEISDKCRDQLDRWANSRTDPNPLIQKMTTERVKHLASGINGSIFPGRTMRLMHHRAFFVWAKSGKPKSIELEQAVNVRESFQASLEQAGIANRVLGKDSIVSLTSDWISRTRDPYPAQIVADNLTPLNEQAVEPDSKLRVRMSNLVLNEGTEDAFDVRVFTVKKRPRIWAQWQNQDLLGSLFQDAMRYTGSVLMVTSFYIPKQERMIEKATTEALKTTKKAEDRSILAALNPNVRQQAQEWLFVKKHMDDGEKAIKLHQSVILFAPDGEGNRCEETAKAIFESAKGWRLKKIRFLSLAYFMTCIPFSAAEGLFDDLDDLGMTRHMMSWNLANISNLQGEWRGQNCDPLLLLLGRRGQLMNINPFKNPDGNFNMAVVGKSGSGKSVTMNYITECVLAAGGRDFTIDIGGSYKYSCELFSGTYIDLDDNLSLNPFSNIGPAKNASPQEQNEYWQEVNSLITSIVASMARQRQDITDTEESILSDVIPVVINKYRQDTTFTLIHDEMMSRSEEPGIPETTRAIIYELALTIKPFTNYGPWGKFFERPCNINFDSRYVVLETEKFAQGGARMLQVVMKILMFHVTEKMYLGDRKSPVILKIDEGWKLLEGRDAKFVEDISRRARKYVGALVTGTQGVDDYFRNPAAAAVFANSDWLFMMSQKKESIAALAESKRVALDDYQMRLLKSVRRDDERYSEVMIFGPGNINAIGRVTLDRFSISSYSTKGEDYTRVGELKTYYGELGGGSNDLVMALEHMKLEYMHKAAGYSAQEANKMATDQVLGVKAA
ncbi:TPA: type IV secretion system protein TraC [Aeromonas hydrophila]|nr:type IV secretion system protein TraC [Aeromonas hydrophila]